jgi:uncharacterized protein
MAYLSTPGPKPMHDDKPFWDWCRRRELRFQRCGNCHAFRHPPVPACPRCRSFVCEWVRAPDPGRLFSYTVVYHPVSDSIRERVPYNIVVVQFAGIDGVRLVSNVVDLAPEKIRIGMELWLVWEVADNGVPLPRFTASASAENLRVPNSDIARNRRKPSRQGRRARSGAAQ